MAELHVVGQLLGAEGFEFPSLFCKWTLEAGPSFRVLQGASSGQTQCDTPNVSPTRSKLDLYCELFLVSRYPRQAVRSPALAQEGEGAVWGHPLDTHYTLKSIDGWPRLLVCILRWWGRL